MNRRDFFRLSAAPVLLPVGRSAWAALAGGGPKRLVVIFLRGAIDGINVVIPYDEKAYYDVRPTIAIGRPGTDGGVLPLDSHFGLHPALVRLIPLWTDKALAFVHAAGSPDPTRSHFDAQLFIENGTPGRNATPDGWMNRLLAALPAPHGPTDAVSIGLTLPAILKGRLPVANLPLGPRAARSNAARPCGGRPGIRSPVRRRRRYREGLSRRPGGARRVARRSRRGDAARRQRRPAAQRLSCPGGTTRSSTPPRPSASGSPSPASEAGTPTLTRVIKKASSPIICGLSATV